jgi:hypothetical protein
MKFCIFDPGGKATSKLVRELSIPDQLDASTQMAQEQRAHRLHQLRCEGEQLKSQITDPIMRAGLRRYVSGV